MQVRRRSFLAAGVAVAATARTSFAQTPISSVRVFAAVTASLPITVSLDSVVIAPDVPYAGVTPYQFGRPGDRHIYAFNPPQLGALSPLPLLDVLVTLRPSEAHTIVVAGSALGGVYNATLLTDDLTPPGAGRVKVRFINASLNSTLSIDGNGAPWFTNVSYLSATPYREFSPALYRLSAAAQGIDNLIQPETIGGGTPVAGRGPTFPLPNGSIFEAGAIYSVVAIGNLARDPYLQLVVMVDLFRPAEATTPRSIDAILGPYLR